MNSRVPAPRPPMRERERPLQVELSAFEARDLYRRRRVVSERGSTPRVVVDGHHLVDFCSNDYLGLGRDPRIARAMARAATAWGPGATSAHLVTGHTAAHHGLEEDLAIFTGRERALLFSTGYMANLGVVSALAGRHDLIVEDRLNHASLVDAARLAGARVRRYRHGDVGSAETRLEKHGGRRRLLLTDGVFSMDGDLAPLRALVGATARHDAWLVVDDAHGLGVLGESGGGSLDAAGLGQEEVPVLVGTLGKAFGTFGAFVAGSAALVETLVQKARTYIYTTAPPPAVAEATRMSLAIARDESWRRQKLAGLVARFRAGAERLGIPLSDSRTPIQPIVVGEAAAALAVSEDLFRQGFWVTAIRPPTVPVNSARLRVTLCALHREEDVDDLLDALSHSRIPVASS
jgi:8-amino-7-oxononanoate synthase